MTTAAWILVAVMASFSTSAVLVWFWGKKNGLYDENIKYRMLEDND
ncbi:hypothetical protein [Bacillus marinisedimentorum]|nr:hypothetical protein [Bacillus marinisedimentorum]